MSMRNETRVMCGIIGGGLMSVGLMTFPLQEARNTEDRIQAEYRGLIEKCDIERDGSAKCPSGTFKVRVAPRMERAK